MMPLCLQTLQEPADPRALNNKIGPWFYFASWVAKVHNYVLVVVLGMLGCLGAGQVGSTLRCNNAHHTWQRGRVADKQNVC